MTHFKLKSPWRQQAVVDIIMTVTSIEFRSAQSLEISSSTRLLLRICGDGATEDHLDRNIKNDLAKYRYREYFPDSSIITISGNIEPLIYVNKCKQQLERFLEHTLVL